MKILKLLQELIECWNCGKTFDERNYEYCPRCGEHKDTH